MILLACVEGAKRGGEGEGEKRESGQNVLSPFFPSSLSPSPFNACYAGYYFVDVVFSCNVFNVFLCIIQGLYSKILARKLLKKNGVY